MIHLISKRSNPLARQFRLASQFRIASCASLLLCLTSTCGAQQSTNQPPFPSPATPRLAANFQVTVSGQSLRELVHSLQTSTKLPVLLDRRLDPSALAIPQRAVGAIDPQAAPELQPTTLGPNLHQSLDLLLKLRNEPPPNAGIGRPIEEWASAGEIVIVGPAGESIRAATEILEARVNLQPHLGQYPPRGIRWPELTTPQEALKIVADTWDLDTSAVELPHDLWPETNLGTVHVTTALGAIASQFGLHFELDARSAKIRSRPLKPAPVVRLTYPSMELTDGLRAYLSRIGGRLVKRPNHWELTGDATAHFQMELAIFKQGSSGKNSSRAITRFTFKFIGTVDGALTNLCQAGNLTLDATALSDSQKRQRIELEVKDQSIEQILQTVANKAGLQLEIAGDQVTVKL